MFTTYLRELQRSPKWLKVVNAIANTCLALVLLMGVLMGSYLLKVWFFG